MTTEIKKIDSGVARLPDGSIAFSMERAYAELKKMRPNDYTVNDLVLLLLYAHDDQSIRTRTAMFKEIFVIEREVFGRYLFTWNNIHNQVDQTNKLADFIAEYFDFHWVRQANVKMLNSWTIRVYDDAHSLSLVLRKDKTKVVLQDDYHHTDDWRPLYSFFVREDKVREEIEIFAKIKRIEDCEFIPYYYGPYSFHVANKLDNMVELGIIERQGKKNTIAEEFKITETDGTVTVVKSGVEYLASSPAKREQFLRFIIKMQSDLGLEVITIPYLALPFDEYKQLARDVTRVVRKEGREPMFVFDLGYKKGTDTFQDAISFFIKDIDIKLMAFQYKSFINNPVSYDVLSRYVAKDVAFLALDVPRETLDSLSEMHSLPFLGTDIYAVESPRYIPPKPKPGTASTKPQKQQEIKKEKIKFFNRENLLVESSTTRMVQPRSVLQEINADNPKLLAILNDYPIMDNDQDKLGVLRSFSKIHELKSSTMEFGSVRDLIDDRAYTEYIRGKKSLDSSLSKLKERKKK